MLAAALCAAAPAGAADLEPAPPELTGRELARRAEDSLRSGATYLEASMTMVSPRRSRPRQLLLRCWDDRANRRSLIRILAPPRDAGTAFLKLHPNLWMFVPREERTVRIPPSLMLQPWMGSDFSNDDLLNESSEVDDYEHRLLGVDPRAEAGDGLRAYVVEYLPHEDAPVVWGRILAWIETAHGTPLRMDYFDEAGERLRELRFGDIRAVQGRRVPFRWSMLRLDEEGRETRIELEEIRFDQSFDEELFTTRELTRRD